MILEAIAGLQCYQCNWMVPADPFHYTCPKCGKNLDYVYDYDLIQREWTQADLLDDPEPSMWRYHPLLPVKSVPENLSLQVGGTPLVRYTRLASDWGLGAFLIKDETRNPSGSLKDRASELGIQHARELGKNTMVAASTGNAGSSLAALSAFHGMESIIFVPASAPPAKLTQIRQHGARLVAINGNYDTAFDLAFKWASKKGHYSRNTGINPILSEGKKTAAIEIAEQCRWQVPDHIFVPVGDGCIIAGLYKGFFDLLSLGWIEQLPRLHAVQAAGSSAIVNSLTRNGEIQPVNAATVADSISVDMPRDGEKARRAVLESGGLGILVSDPEILEAQHELATLTGIFAEPAAAATYAGFKRAKSDQVISAQERVLLLITGSGLKDIPAASAALGKIEVSEPEFEIIDALLAKGGA